MRSENKFFLKRVKKSLVRQLDTTDCGVAALLSVVKYYGGSASLESLRIQSGTNKRGTTILGLFQAAEELGFNAQGYRGNLTELKKLKEPAILHVTLDNKLQHFLVLYGFDSDSAIIGDPAKGVYKMDEEELNRIWASRVCLTLVPGENFIQESENIKHQWRWFFSLLLEDRQILSASILLGVIIAGLGMTMAVFSQKLIDEILPSKNLFLLYSSLSLFFILLIARVAISALREFFLVNQSRDFNNRINSQFYSNLLDLPKSFFSSRKVGEFVARLNDAQRVQKTIKFLVSSIIIDILVSITSLCFLFFYSFSVGLIAVASVPLYFLLIYHHNKKIISAQNNTMVAYAVNQSNYINSIKGISEIKIFNAQSIFRKTNDILFSKLQDQVRSLGIVNIGLSWQAGIAGVVLLTVILGYGSTAVFHETLQLGELMAIVGISGTLLPSVTKIALVAIPISEAKIAFNRMYEFAGSEIEQQGTLAIDRINKVEVHNLSFRFKGSKVLFEEVNFTCKKGKITAVVGESGSGKTTIGEILLKFHDPANGEIILNEQFNLKEVEISSYRKVMGVVPQNIFLFNGTILENILLGADLTEEEVYTFLKEYKLKSYFQDFPNGLHTIVGEEGLNLSGGQKQILALVRVLISEPQFLLLDESSSAMDLKTEKLFIEILHKVKQECAVLLISHRLYNLASFADEICVLENGRMVKKGSHQKLLESRNFYSEFWEFTHQNHLRQEVEG